MERTSFRSDFFITRGGIGGDVPVKSLHFKGMAVREEGLVGNGSVSETR